MVEFLTSMGEPLVDTELEYFIALAEAKDSSNPGEIDIKKLAVAMIPSDDVLEDLKQ